MHHLQRENEFKLSWIKSKSELYWLNILLNTVPCGVIILDRWNKSKFLVNKEVLKIFNFDKNHGETTLLNVEDVKEFNLYRSNGEKLTYKDFPTIKSIKGENIKDLELILKSGTNKKNLVITDSLPIYGKSGDILAAITMISDISNFKNVEKDLIRATKGRKLISQDFNDRVLNILNSLISIFEINEEYDLGENKDETGINSDKLNITLLHFVHEILSSYDHVDIEIKEYVQLIFSEIQEIYENEVDLKVYGQVPMTLDMLMNCGLIINDIIAYRLQSFQSNLNINAVIADRFPSFHNDKKFEMWIQLSSNEGKINIKICDNGPKVPLWVENQIEKLLKIANQLLEQLSGFIKIDSNNQVTSFDLEFLYLEI